MADPASQLTVLCSTFVCGPSDPANSTGAAAASAPIDEGIATNALNALMLMVHGRRATLKDIVTSSAAHLTSSDALYRRRGVLLLSELLTRLPTLALDEKAIHTLIVFFTERLKDTECQKETLLGLNALVQNRILTSEQSIIVVRALFDHVAMSGLTQSGRKLALDCVRKILLTSPAEFIALGEYGISGLVRCIDGEKDPRNLLITFQLARFILAGGSTGASYPAASVQAYVEEVFEITSCYFPITFHPPANDPIGITGLDLQTGLRQVFSAHPALAEYVIPMLLEKLDTTVVECKLDVLETLRHCIASGTYTVLQLDPFLGLIAKALQKEMFQGGAEYESVIRAASLTFSSLIGLLCPDQVGGFAAGGIAPSWILLMAPLLEDIASELKMPDSKQARYHATLLQLVCATTVNAFARSMQVLFHSSIESKFFSQHVQPTQRVAILDLLNLLIAAANQKYEFTLPHHPLQPYSEAFLAMMSSVLLDGSAEQRAIALQGMADLSALPPFTVMRTNDTAAVSSGMDIDSGNATVTKRLLPTEQVRAIVQTLTDRLLTDDDAMVRDRCLSGLVKLSQDQLYCSVVLKLTLPALFNARTMTLLPDTTLTPAPSSANAPVSDLDRLSAVRRLPQLSDILDAACALCRHSSLLSSTLPHLLQMVHTHFIGALQGQATSLQAIYMVLSCLSEIVIANSQSAAGKERLECCITTLPHSLIGLLVNGSLLITKVSAQFALDSKVIHTAVLILQTVTRVANVAAQQILIDNILKLFLDGNVGIYAQAELPVPSDIPFTPLIIAYDPSQPILTAKSQLQLLPLFTAVIGSYRSGVNIPRMAEVIRRLGWFIDTHADIASEAQQSAIECLAAIINKLPVTDILFTEFIDQHLEKVLLVQMQDNTCSLPKRMIACNVMIWMTKALVMRNHPHGVKFAEKLIQILMLHPTAPTLAETIARGMSLILRDCSSVLNREAHANCGPGQLYKQRFFVQNLPHLLTLFNSTTSQGTAASSASSSPLSILVTAGAPAPSSSRFVILLAVSHLLKHVPHTVVMESLTTLIPLLLQSLTHTESELRISALETVTTLLRGNVNCMSKHLSTLIPVLLELMRFKANTRVRLNALECLSHLRSLPYSELHPFRSSILLTLGLCVDDHKRVVRQFAAKSRNQWYLLASSPVSL